MSRRLASVLAGGSLALLALLVDPRALGPSWFFEPARLAVLRPALGLLGALVALAPWWLAWLRRAPRDPSAAAPGSPGALEAFFVLLLGALAALTWARDDPVTKDTKFYLGEALDIAQRGGVPGLLERCLDGSWTEDNRHPLYLALLAPCSSASNAFLARARLVAFAGAVLTLLLALRACRRRGGAPAALVCGGVLVSNAAFVEHSVLVACESWWTVFAVAAVDLATRADALRSWTRWCGAGACVGLAFLTKGTGVLLLVAIAGWILLVERRGAWRPLLLFGAGFVAGAWPLLVRNQLRFGDPLWNVNSRRAMWLDQWKEFFDAEAMQQASAAHYWASHSLSDALARFGMGAAKQAFHLLEACAPVGTPTALGLVPLALFAVGGLRMADRRLRALLLVLTGLWLASFAWYAPIASDRRFLAVLLPIAAPALIPWALRLPLDLRPAPSARRAALALALALLAWWSPPALRTLSFEPAPWNEALRGFLAQRTHDDRDAIYWLGPSSDLGFDWDRTLLATRATRPRDTAEVERWLGGSSGERYGLLVVERHPGPPRFGDEWVEVSPGGELRAARVPAGWRQIAAFPPEAPRVLVFGR